MLSEINAESKRVLNATLSAGGLAPVKGTIEISPQKTISATVEADLGNPVIGSIIADLTPLRANISGEVPTRVATTKVLMNSTAYWDSVGDTVPSAATIIVYSDYMVTEIGGEQVVVPGVKIADGVRDIASLPFITDFVMAIIQNHINNTEIHITQEERDRWNNMSLTLRWDYDL